MLSFPWSWSRCPSSELSAAPGREKRQEREKLVRKKQQKSPSRANLSTKPSFGAAQGEPHQRLPAEDVAVEADPVLGEVEAALQENVPLEST